MTPPETTATALPVSIEDVRAAHARIRDSIVRTPTFISKTLSPISSASLRAPGVTLMASRC